MTQRNKETKKQRSILKWGIIAVVILTLIGTMIGCGGSDSNQKADDTTAAQQTEKSEEQEPTTEEAKEEVPTEYISALKKAEIYSSTMFMSKQGIYDQLTAETGEQFSAEAAQYAIDNIEADWNANALEKAKSYQDTMSMSPEAIRDQLTSQAGEKFTEEEAEYAISNLK